MTRGPIHGIEVSLGGLGVPLTSPKAGLPVLAPPGRDFLFFFLKKWVLPGPRAWWEGVRAPKLVPDVHPAPATACMLAFLSPLGEGRFQLDRCGGLR